jgi:hypothetical protein
MLRARDGLALAVFLGLSALVFGRALVTDAVFYERDIFAFWYPHIEVFVRAVAEGSAPLWNPYVAFGGPLLANPSLQIAYPPTWLNLVLAPSAYYKLFVLGHTAWAGTGLCLLARRLGLGPLPALLGGGAFCLSGPYLSSLSLFHHFATCAWMPWVLLAALRLLEQPGLARGLLLAVAAAGQLLAGSADVVLMTGIATALLVASSLRARGLRPGPGRVFGHAALSALLALGLAAVQWLPTAAVVGEGWRLRLSAATNLYWSLHPLSLVDGLVPGLVARLPVSDALRAALFESREPLFKSVYLGVAAFYVAVIGVLLRSPLRRTLLLGFVFFVLCALGRHTFLLPSLLGLPGFAVIRYPAKYLWGASLFWALLAAGGAQEWGRPWSDRDRRKGALGALAMALLSLAAFAGAGLVWTETERIAPFLDGEGGVPFAAAFATRRLLSAGAALALAAAFASWRARRETPSPRSSVALASFVLVDLVAASGAAFGLAPAALLEHRPALLDRIEPGARVHAIGLPPAQLRRRLMRDPAGWPPEPVWVLGNMDTLAPPTPARWGLRGSFDGDFTGLADRSYWQFVALSEAAAGKRQGRTLLERGGVGYVVTLREGDLGGLEEVARAKSVFTSPVRLLRVGEPLPLAYVVEGVRPAAFPETLIAMGDPRFDARREAAVPPGEPESDAREGFRGEVRIVEQRADTLVLEAELNRAGLLVVLEAYDPGWRAELDGASAPIVRANGLFRGVRLGPGRHLVRMVYRPLSATLGAGLSALSLLAVVGLSLRERGRAAAAQPRAAW